MSRVTALAGEVLTVLVALVMLIAFFYMPWYERDEAAGYVTGEKIVADVQGDLDLAGRASHLFLVVIPIAAMGALALGAWNLVAPQPNRKVPGIILLLGLASIGYYYGAFVWEDSTNSASGFDFVGAGFYVALVAGLGLVIQFLIPRAGARPTVSLTPFVRPQKSESRGVRSVFRTGRRWLRALVGWPLTQIRRLMRGTPLLAYLLGLWAAFELEQRAAVPLARLLEFQRNRPPTLFGVAKLMDPFELDFSGILAPFFPSPSEKYDAPLRASWDAIRQIFYDIGDAFISPDTRAPGFFETLKDVAIYDVLIYVIPMLLVALVMRSLSNWLLRRMPHWSRITLQLGVLYMVVSAWRGLNDYRELVLIYMGINIMLAVSLNLVNGYMGEFSVGHAGFMAVGAYVSSILTMWMFLKEPVFNGPVVAGVGHYGEMAGFFIALIAGGAAAAVAGLLVAFPSFRTRGDYLAIVTLAVNFIITGFINTQEWIGGSRGLRGIPIWTDLPWVFVITTLSVLGIYHLVTSTFGKGIIAIREDEIAAELMGINTQRVKLVAFMVSSFIAGASGGLFAHYLAYVNPGTFDILKSTEALVMVYLGGMGSISGSVIAAVIFTILIEALRPLGVMKWVLIPLTLILLMLYRPQGLFGFREINLNLGAADDNDNEKEVSDDSAAD
jgi:branched-chain amino acid transport system permease protein